MLEAFKTGAYTFNSLTSTLYGIASYGRLQHEAWHYMHRPYLAQTLEAFDRLDH